MKRILLFFAIYLIALNSFGQYCAVSATNSCDEHISNVEFNSVSNPSGCTGAYTDYTAVSFDIGQGGIAHITVHNGQAFDENECGIWIDWNNNENFLDDPAITVLDEYFDEYYTAVITCPDNTTLGPKRMRVRIVYAVTPNPCGVTSWGETEDYTINVIPTPEHDMAVISVTDLVSGPSLSASEDISVLFKNAGTTTETNVSVWYRVNNGEIITETINGNLESFEDTLFTFSAKANLSTQRTDYTINAGVNIPDDTNSENDNVSITIRNTLGDHCEARAQASSGESIYRVEFGDIDNYTNWSGYRNYNNLSTEISIGGIEFITVYCAEGYLEDLCGIWVDWNDNADFTDDPAVTVTRVDKNEFTAAIICPDETELGNKRLRIRLMLGGNLSPCGIEDAGEVEDYTINVTSSPAHDIAAMSIISPVSGYYLSDSEDITVKYKNIGTSTETNVIVGYFINDGDFIRDTIYGDIESLEDTIFTFRVKADLSIHSTDYEIYAGVDLSNDENADNDHVFANIRNTYGEHCFTGNFSDELFISSVEIGTILNADSEWSENGYGDYNLMSTDIIVGTTENIIINCEGDNTDSQCGIWVDWNENGDFTEETPISVNGIPGNGQYTAVIACPEGTEIGSKKMRIRLGQGDISSPCGIYEFGETEDYRINVIQLTVNPKYVAKEKGAGSTDYTVTSNVDWEASSDQAWCTVTPEGSGDGTITAIYEENTGLSPRFATITVSGTNGGDQDVILYQFGTAPSLVALPSIQSVDTLSGSIDYLVLANVDWTASSDQAWCTVTPSGTAVDSVTVTYTENTSVIERTANIIITGTGDLRDTVVLRQAGATPFINITPAQRSVPATSGTTDFTITSNTNWTVTSDQTWCTVTPSGSKNGTITVNYTGNSGIAQRIAIITVSGSGVQDKTVSLIQSGLSDISSAKINSDVIIYPTSGQGIFKIKMSGPESGKVTVRIINMQGVIVDELQFNKDSQSAIFNVSMSNAVKGLYLVQTVMNNYAEIQRIVVK